MASGFVGPTVGRLTCRVGKELVCCFHTPKSCPLLLRLALLLVFGLCVWKWTTSGDILDENQDCSIDSSCMTNIKILPHKMADFVCIHWVNCISEYSKVKLERNYVQLFYCQPLTSLRTTHLIR